MPEPKERRKKPRVPLEGEALVFQGSERIACKSLNISENGVAVLSPVHGKRGLFVRVQLCFLSMAKWLPFDGILIRLEEKDGRYLWGIRFEGMESWVTASVETYISEQFRTQVKVPSQGSISDSLIQKEALTRNGRLTSMVKKVAGIVSSSKKQPSRQATNRPGKTAMDKDMRDLYTSAIRSMDEPGTDKSKKKKGKKR